MEAAVDKKKLNDLWALIKSQLQIPVKETVQEKAPSTDGVTADTDGGAGADGTNTGADDTNTGAAIDGGASAADTGGITADTGDGAGAYVS